MSEHLRNTEAKTNHHETLQQSREAVHEVHREHKEVIRESHEQHSKKVESLRDTVEQFAVSKEESPADALKNEQRPTDHHYLTKHIKLDKYTQTLAQIRTQLTPNQRRLSKFIHQPKVEAISEVGAKTVARPSGILGGALLSLCGSLAIIIVAKRIGFEVPSSVFAVLFLVGFVAGLLFEATVAIFKRGQKPPKLGR